MGGFWGEGEGGGCATAGGCRNGDAACQEGLGREWFGMDSVGKLAVLAMGKRLFQKTAVIGCGLASGYGFMALWTCSRQPLGSYSSRTQSGQTVTRAST